MTRSWPLTVKELARFPAVPPSRAVRFGTTARRALLRAHARTGLAEQVLLERSLGALDAPALYAVVELGIPDHLDRPRTANDLALRVGAEPINLERLLAFLASRGCIRRDRRGRYHANRVTKLLTREGGWAGWALFLGAPWTMAACSQLIAAVRDGKDPVTVAHDVDFFGYVATHPEAARAFHDSQAAGARLHAILCEPLLALDEVSSVLDVGGGTGSIVTHLLAVNPHLRGAVVDLSAAEAGARANFAEACVADRASFVVGDFFREVPAGYDLHVLTSIIHDWDDDDCVRILGNCVRALNPGGRIFVVETELVPGELGSFVQATDALMLAFTSGGRERTRREFDALWERAGLRCAKRTALAQGTLFELRPVT